MQSYMKSATYAICDMKSLAIWLLQLVHFEKFIILSNFLITTSAGFILDAPKNNVHKCKIL